MAGVSTSLEVSLSLFVMSLVPVQSVRAISRMVMTSSVPISRLLSMSSTYSGYGEEAWVEMSYVYIAV
ncbi:hypothetical protein YC2023_116919 [Brassica napus]